MGGDALLLAKFLDSTTSPEDLASILGTSYRKLKYFYYSSSTSRSYSIFEIPKKSGGKRLIYAPNRPLKTLQSRLAFQLSRLYKPRKVVKAFVDKTSIRDNAIPHVRKKFVFNIDLVDFFPSISFARVRGLLIAKPYSLKAETASVIAHLVTVNGFLPQGSPSSPIISNMICASLDRQLYGLAIKNRCVYTRYADDITFSFYCPIGLLPKGIVTVSGAPDELTHYQCGVGGDLLSVVKSSGFGVNYAKVRLQGQYERQVVTGLTVNAKPNVGRVYVRKTSALIHSIEKYGVEQASAINIEKHPEGSTKLEAHIQGRLLFLKQIMGAVSPVYRRLAIRFNMLPTQYKVPIPTLDSYGAQHAFRLSKSLVRKCWVIEAEGKIGEEEYYSQGSGFMLSDGLLITCAHVLSQGKLLIPKCSVYRADKRSEIFSAEVVYRDDGRDLAILKMTNSGETVFDFFSLETGAEPNVGERVAVLGFPNDKLGSIDVGSLSVKITNKYPLHAVSHSEVDKTLYSGNSGGPVINYNQHVVGIAAKGAAGNPGGHNTFIRVVELFKVLEAYKAL